MQLTMAASVFLSIETRPNNRQSIGVVDLSHLKYATLRSIGQII